MAAANCAVCGREEFLPFRCRLCAQPHCLEHRLPENHACPHLADYRSRVRVERSAVAEPEGLQVRVRGGPRLGTRAAPALAFFRRSMTHRLLGVLLVVYAFQLAGGAALGLVTGVGAGAGVGFLTCQLALGSCLGATLASPEALLLKPWSLLTNVVTHSTAPVPFLHLLFNVIFLYFFGTALEQRVGSRKLLAVFLAAGVAAGIAQAVLFPGAVLGASGALMGVLGVLTVLAPQMRVIFFFVPLPLWVLTVIFVLMDVTGMFAPRGIANLAHLAGLAIGLAEGERLRRRGVLPRMASWASQRRL